MRVPSSRQLLTFIGTFLLRLFFLRFYTRLNRFKWYSAGAFVKTAESEYKSGNLVGTVNDT